MRGSYGPAAQGDIGVGLPSGVVERLKAGDSETAATLAKRGENQWVELKERLPQASELAALFKTVVI
jgi:hypothetical protein